jgi:hypothetical protein
VAGVHEPIYAIEGVRKVDYGVVPPGPSTTYGGKTAVCPEGYSRWSGGVELLQDKDTGSVVVSRPLGNGWDAEVANPGLLGESGHLFVEAYCFRPVYHPVPSQGADAPVTGVSVAPVQETYAVNLQVKETRHALCKKAGPGYNAYGGGFYITHSWSAAPFDSVAEWLGRPNEPTVNPRVSGWEAGVSNIGIGETPGLLTVDALCVKLLHQPGRPPLESLSTTVARSVVAVKDDDVGVATRTCPEGENFISYAIGGGFALGFNLAKALPHIARSFPVDTRGPDSAWQVLAVNPPTADATVLFAYAICLIEGH